ncbi:replication protein [Salinibacter ruber]|uniref:replication protein n=1 Tax=Salinibacter ruber TaxID=146919 RepID=UPI002167C9FF|nr:hypothetical protein [Salinibacter ruber]
MPRLLKSARARPGSNSPVDPPQKAAPPSPQFTESQQFSPLGGPDRGENPSQETGPDSAERLSPNTLSAEKLSLDATEPFPDGLFRVPLPNVVFGRMPSVSDSALRCLLALVHLSFRFDPAKDEWVHSGEWFPRSDVEAASGLSDQGTRNGLAELQSLGWAAADQAGRSHRFQLEIEVPARRFTYVPTALLEGLSGFDSGTELRVVLAVLRGTWGWTRNESEGNPHGENTPQSGQPRVVHDRWAQLSNRKLAEATGRSETAVTRAAKTLQGEWIERVRPGNGPHQYRFLPEEIGDRSSSFGGGANDLPPDRQNSDPPFFNKESFSRDKQRRDTSNPEPDRDEAPPSGKRDAVRENKPTRGSTAPKTTATANDSTKASPPPDLSELSPQKRQLAEKLANVGVWAGRIAELVSRFSLGRIRANFQLYRRRAAEQTIRRPGAWLHEAIVEGYALESSGEDGPGEAPKDGLPALKHKETVSEAKKEACVAQGISEERFHRCLSGRSEPRERQFMYFDPEVGEPSRRRQIA